MSKNMHITSHHLNKKAIIYVRQSTMHQVLTHKESLKLQYSLKDKAMQYGWREDQVEIVDSDLGITGTTIENRNGFKHILSEVALENVGIIFSYDATRLSRNCSDWYQLLDICSFKKCLIGDIDSIYDPSTMNGRLLLGIKGQLAEIELNMIKSRLIAGRDNKARRGELSLKLPVGLIRNTDKKVEKDPNIEVQHSINMIFETFFRVKSVSMTLKYFIKNNLLIPRYNELNQLLWKKPSYSDILNFLKNPAYAGAFVFGKTCQTTCLYNPKKLKNKTVPYSDWKYVIHNQYPNYITWEQYQMIREILTDNSLIYVKNSKGTSRHGSCLLQGIVYCGQCGHKMVVEYNKGKTYICNHLARKYNEKLCQTIVAHQVDDAVVLEFLNALSDIELNAYEKIISMRDEQNQRLNISKEQKIKRLRYQAQLAENRFNQVDPNNRLVAEELERRWEHALIELKEENQNNLSKSIDLNPIPDEIKLAFTDLGKLLPTIWNKDILDNKNKKDFLRCLIDKVILTRGKRDIVDIRIAWKGGEVSELSIIIKISSYKNSSNYNGIKKIIIDAYENKKTDKEISELLSEQSFKTPSLTPIRPNSVEFLRRKLGLVKPRGGKESIRVKGYLTIKQVCDKLGLDRSWLYGKIRSGKIKVKKYPELDVYLFPDTKATEKQFKLFLEKKRNSLTF